MKRLPEHEALIGKLIIMSLSAMIVLSVACQNGSGSDNNIPSGQNNQTGNARTGGVTTPNSQTDTQMGTNDVANNNHRPADSVGERSATKPGIRITDVPPRGAGPEAVERIAGTASGVSVKECKVVIFARTDKWYVQPYIASPDTSINDDGSWENDTHLGSEYAALLVKTSYKPPA